MIDYITCNGCGAMLDSEFVSAPNINTYLCPSCIAIAVHFGDEPDEDTPDEDSPTQRGTNET